MPDWPDRGMKNIFLKLLALAAAGSAAAGSSIHGPLGVVVVAAGALASAILMWLHPSPQAVASFGAEAK